ncbi:MAG: hypothetical protein IH587_06310 [Anaerolineae bacterium]|nr:hypothetical protein [Anaerolineae bacterium]
MRHMRVFLRMILLLVPTFALIVAGIQLLPHETTALDTLLPGEDNCALPCALGIIPGITSLDDAGRILNAHPWVADYQLSRSITVDSGYLIWHWSGAQPAIIDGQQEAALWVENGRVEWIQITTRLPFGDLWLRLGRPSGGYVWYVELTAERIFQRMYYQAHDLLVEFDVLCPAHLNGFWSAPVRLRYGVQPADDAQAYQTPRWGMCG